MIDRTRALRLSDSLTAAVYLFVRDTWYSSMFRYNARGDFTVPYGSISYNARTFDAKLLQYNDIQVRQNLEQTLVSCDDFHSVFRRYPVPQDDFVFLDLPYDTEFSTYDKNAFSRADHQRLTRYLLKACAGRFMLVIKHTACANGRRIRGRRFDKKYVVSFKNRNTRDARHLVITNYLREKNTDAY